MRSPSSTDVMRGHTHSATAAAARLETWVEDALESHRAEVRSVLEKEHNEFRAQLKVRICTELGLPPGSIAAVDSASLSLKVDKAAEEQSPSYKVDKIFAQTPESKDSRGNSKDHECIEREDALLDSGWPLDRYLDGPSDAQLRQAITVCLQGKNLQGISLKKLRREVEISLQLGVGGLESRKEELKTLAQEVATQRASGVDKSKGNGIVATVPGEGNGKMDAPATPEYSSEMTPTTENRTCAGMMRDFVHSAYFETAFSLLIIMNTIVMIFEAQYKGIDAGWDIGYPTSVRPAKEAWPFAAGILDVTEMFFGVVFTIEVLVKLVCLRLEFFTSAWNWFDLFIVSFWHVDLHTSSSLPMNPMILRLCRLARLMRLIKLVKMVTMFDALHLLIGSIRASFSTLLWAMVLLLSVMTICMLCFSHLLRDYILDETQPPDKRFIVYKYYGTASRGLLTMFEITLANWVNPARVLTENVDEAYVFFFMCYRSLVGFSLVTVITGVFMQLTLKCAAENYDLMIIQRQRHTTEHMKKMTRLFSAADHSGDGAVSWDEFATLLKDESVRLWLAAMELDPSDGKLLFDLLSEGNEHITPAQLIHGVSTLKGAARSIDLRVMMRSNERLMEQLRALEERFSTLSI